jgi:hypothetical protein
MLIRNLLYVIGALMFILGTGQPVHSQSTPEIPLKKRSCSDLQPVEQNNKWGYIDQTGRLVIPFTFDSAGNFSEGLAVVNMQEKSGYIDKTGKIVIPPRFISGFSFSEGLAAVLTRQIDQEGKTPRYEYSYIDRSGRVVIQPPQDPESIKWFAMVAGGLAFSEGLAFVAKGKLGFIDKAGKQVIPLRYDDAQPFSEGLAAVSLKDKYGYIDRSGKMVIPPRFSSAGPFSEGLAAVENGAQEGYIDKTGKLVINGAEFSLARAFSEGLAAVQGKNERYGFIDKTGKFVIPPQFRRVGDFSDGLAAVQLAGVDWPGNLAYINQQGEMVIKSMSTFPNNPDKNEFDLHNYRFCGGVARVSQGNKEDEYATGYINKKGKFIWPKGTAAKEGLR